MGSGMTNLIIDGSDIADTIQQFRKSKPHIHCITNSVAQHFTANVLLAAGATPSMTIAVEEVPDFVAMADALLVNLGTMDDQRSKAVDWAVEAAQHGEKPWALDPVFVQASPLRLQQAQKLIALHPALIRCNDAELSALKSAKGSKIFDEKICFVMTGEVDEVLTTNGRAKVSNGSAMMDRVTAMGCALTALIIGFMAVERDPLRATCSALVLYGVAGEIAEGKSEGPGTFVPAFLDALHTVSPDDVKQRARFA